MTLSLFQILILSAIQGAAELLPVSSSAHVVIAEKLMGLDPVDAGDGVAPGDAAHGYDVRGDCIFSG